MHVHKAVANRGPLDDLLIFHELARALTSELDLRSILRIVAEYTERFIKADLWALLMVDSQSEELYYVSVDGRENARLSDIRIKIGEGLAGWVAQHGETLLVPDASQDVHLGSAADRTGFLVRSAIGLPIRGRKGTHGVLEIFNPHLDENADYLIAFLHILVDYAAIAIENAQDVARIQQLTITDDVTGLYNARHLYKMLSHELEIAQRQSGALSLVFLDLDRFKDVNDRHGHLIGTELLAKVGTCLKELSRRSDLCVRYGGDEFVILMPGTTREQALQLARAMHEKLSQSLFAFGKDLQLRIGASAGIAAYPGDGRTVHEILGAADQRMYRVKGTGRGRVEA
jgi:diguanylate cyclase (GGDEF)-like protein